MLVFPLFWQLPVYIMNKWFRRTGRGSACMLIRGSLDDIIKLDLYCIHLAVSLDLIGL
jgi:hypothetical protein